MAAAAPTVPQQTPAEEQQNRPGRPRRSHLPSQGREVPRTQAPEDAASHPALQVLEGVTGQGPLDASRPSRGRGSRLRGGNSRGGRQGPSREEAAVANEASSETQLARS